MNLTCVSYTLHKSPDLYINRPLCNIENDIASTYYNLQSSYTFTHVSNPGNQKVLGFDSLTCNHYDDQLRVSSL